MPVIKIAVLVSMTGTKWNAAIYGLGVFSLNGLKSDVTIWFIPTGFFHAAKSHRLSSSYKAML